MLKNSDLQTDRGKNVERVERKCGKCGNGSSAGAESRITDSGVACPPFHFHLYRGGKVDSDGRIRRPAPSKFWNEFLHDCRHDP
jgi:hypothetical protein